MASAIVLHLDQQGSVCSLCHGVVPRLTFEHIPPKRCFNNYGVAASTMESLRKGFDGAESLQGGMGRKSLCADCNNKTGRWYGSSMAQFYAIAMEYYSRACSRAMLLPFTIEPLEVAKQVLTGLIAANTPSTTKAHSLSVMRHLVLHPSAFGAPRQVRLFTYFCEGKSRVLSHSGHLSLNGVGPFLVIGEFARPPLGFVAIYDEPIALSLVHALGMADITCFLNRPARIIETFFLRLPRLAPRAGVSPLEYEQNADGPAFDSLQVNPRRTSS